ncbi:hypothetical protein [Bacillus inaquosorum]|uniref:hypothetical protein n=1 Tax=Bacillus inaquosorum TaxID=483913 RepID=UPI002DB6B6A9|nr:hypothetical protein [Bacillus inaquosorum]MEC2062706.1 hypothetical protein [Bacillus inaquosorum]MEC2086151.1 hypothetical protein [Bacillus inaquosorum]
MIRDFEEILLQIKKPHIKDYMTEAVKCYYAGSYRATIIISTIAAMHDLREKIKNLASSIKELRPLDTEIDKRMGNESVYERYMIEQAFSKSILSNSEFVSINTYLDLRNRCAHPNEYHATAEEARMVFTGYFDNIIKRPSLLGAAFIKEVVNKMENELLFPNHTLPSIKKVVNEEIKILHYSAILPLTRNLISIIDAERDLSSIKCRNATLFLSGVLAEENDDDRKRKMAQQLGQLIQNESIYEKVIEIVSFYPQVFNFITEVDRERILSFLKKSISYNMKESEFNLLYLLITTENVLPQKDQADLKDVFKSHIETSIKSNDIIDNESVEILGKWVDKVAKLKMGDIDNAFFATLIELIRDGNFDITNSAVDILKNLDKDFLNRINDEYLVKLFSGLIYQARPGRMYAGRAARKLWDEKFEDFKPLYLKFIDNITEDYEKYLIFYNGTYTVDGNQLLFGIILELNEPDLMQSIVKFMEKIMTLDEGNTMVIGSDLYYLRKKLDDVENELWVDVKSDVERIIEND